MRIPRSSSFYGTSWGKPHLVSQHNDLIGEVSILIRKDWMQLLLRGHYVYHSTQTPNDSKWENIKLSTKRALMILHPPHAKSLLSARKNLNQTTHNRNWFSFGHYGFLRNKVYLYLIHFYVFSLKGFRRKFGTLREMKHR